jgi:hypothetical protein
MPVIRLGSDFARYEFSNDQDIEFLPHATERHGALQVVGGRRIIHIGGRLRYRGAIGMIAEVYKNVSEVVFLEGRHIVMEKSADAFVAGGTSRHELPFKHFPDVYIQNCRVDGVRGAAAALHADALQMDYAARSINVDRFTANTNYQAFFMRPEPSGGRVLSHIDLRRCNFTKNQVPGDPEPTKLIYFATSDAELGAAGHKLYLTEVWCEIPVGENPRDYVYPKVGSALGEDAISSYIWWPELPQVVQDLRGRPGRVRIGSPRGGDFVAAAEVGLDYLSPNYQAPHDLPIEP